MKFFMDPNLINVKNHEHTEKYEFWKSVDGITWEHLKNKKTNNSKKKKNNNQKRHFDEDHSENKTKQNKKNIELKIWTNPTQPLFCPWMLGCKTKQQNSLIIQPNVWAMYYEAL